jgi:hypothetical protein
MNDAAPELSTAARAPGAVAAGSQPPRTFAEQAGRAPPLAWLTALAALIAMVVNQVLLPALGDERGYTTTRGLNQLGAFATNLSAIAGLVALGFALLSFVRASADVVLRQRLLFAAFSGIFVPSVALATLFDRTRTTAEGVWFAMGAAQVLIGLAGGAAARVAPDRYRRVLALSCALMASAGLLAHVLQLASRVELRVWMLTVQRIAQGVGEAGYLILLCGLAPLLMPVGEGARARSARFVGFALLPLALVGLYAAERALSKDYTLLLYHAQRVSLLVDTLPRLYSIPIGLAFATAMAALLGGDRGRRQAAAGALLLLASGYAPFAPGRLLTSVLGVLLVCRSLMSAGTSEQRR